MLQTLASGPSNSDRTISALIVGLRLSLCLNHSPLVSMHVGCGWPDECLSSYHRFLFWVIGNACRPMKLVAECKLLGNATAKGLVILS